MRNLKKILALVLALVMTMSVMSFASAAKAGTDYSDDASITQFDESIQVLTALGIYRGDEGGFRPNSTITRAEAAALVYRIISTDVTDKQTNIYSDYNKFSDVKSDDWFAGYVNFCANGQYIVGNGDGTFNYNGNITGYELLAIILRALGYGKNGEYTGNGWEITTATDARKLGITKNIVESTLGQAQTRAAVAEMLFQGLTCTQTVEYTQLLGYTSGSSTLTGKAVHATLGYENFGLRGFVTASDIETYDPVTNWADVGTVTDGFYLKELTSRQDAVADNSADNTETGVAAAKYGEPVAFWYAKTLVTSTNPDGAIAVRFNPVATYTESVGDTTLFAATGLSGTSVAVDDENYNEDGDNMNDITLHKTHTKASDIEYYGGKGTVTELYVADGTTFVVVKNTYADTVAQAYDAKYGKALTLTGTTGFDGSVDDFAEQKAAIAGGLSNVTGLAKYSVVLFNVYDGTADIETVHTATSKTVTLTNSYIKDDQDPETAYFLVGNTKYEYDCNALHTELAYDLLDRNELLAVGEATQDVYFDDYGYVIYSEATVSATAQGYMIVTSTSYGGYDKDNGYYMNIKGYSLDGKAVTIKGGFDGDFVYDDKSDASDYAAEIGLYFYKIDSDLGLYTLTYQDENIQVAAGDDLYAGDPDALADNAGAIMDSTTVFVIANYSAKGAITGYTVKTGIKNIPDLTDGNLSYNGTSIIYQSAIDYEISYVDNDKVAGGADNVVDLVLVLGAAQDDDTSVNTKTAGLDDVIYLLDTTPLKQFSAYNEYAAIQDGKATTVKVAVSAEGNADQANGYVPLMTDEGFYTITTNGKGYITDAEPVVGGDVDYAGQDVLSYTPGVGDTSIWKFASCHEGKGDEQGDCAYVVLANNCKIYDLTSGTAVAIDAADLYIDQLLDTPQNALGYTSVNAVVADWNGYGFATTIYVVGTPA
jgi:hypothetical protein